MSEQPPAPEQPATPAPPSSSATPAPTPAPPPSAAASAEAAQWGRVDDAGNVFVRTADGERLLVLHRGTFWLCDLVRQDLTQWLAPESLAKADVELLSAR